jgi:hypothetical protein
VALRPVRQSLLLVKTVVQRSRRFGVGMKADTRFVMPVVCEVSVVSSQLWVVICDNFDDRRLFPIFRPPHQINDFLLLQLFVLLDRTFTDIIELCFCRSVPQAPWCASSRGDEKDHN